MSRLRAFRNYHKTDRVYILGNGPSLADVDFNRLGMGCITIGTNRIYLSGFVPDYYICVNPLVMQQFYKEIGELATVKFISESAMATLPADWNQAGEVIPISTDLRVPVFGNIEGLIWEGYTVTYVALQLAYYMGFEEAVLLGVDHDYGGNGLQPNLELVSTKPDVAHFHPEYFGAGVRWNAPDLHNSELAFSLAKEQYEGDGRRIINASERTKLRVFELESLRRVRSKHKPRVSALISAYFCADMLAGCLDDCYQQTEGLEIIVICQEGSKEHDIALKHTHRTATKIITTPDIPTLYKAWNLAIKEATGKYITNANSDDRCHPMKYEIMADLLDARGDIDVVYADQFICWHKPMSYAMFEASYAGNELKLGRFEDEPGLFAWPEYDRALLGRMCILGSAPMWRASLHQLYGGFAEHMKVAGDYEFWLRVSREANMMHIPYPLGVYCCRMNGIEMSNTANSVQEGTAAMELHQDPEGLGIEHLNHITRVELGGHWVYANTEELRKAIG